MARLINFQHLRLLYLSTGFTLSQCCKRRRQRLAIAVILDQQTRIDNCSKRNRATIQR